MAEKHVNTVKAPALRFRDGILELLLFLHKARENTAPQKNGSFFKEKLRWGFGGGQSELKDKTLPETAIREIKEETKTAEGTYLELVPEIFKEEFAVHGPILPSQRDDGSETFQNHFYLILLPSDTEIGEIDPDNDEIIRGEWFSLDRLPMPDDAVPFTQTQLFAFEELLTILAKKEKGAMEYLEIVQKQIDKYEARKENRRRR